MWQFYFLTNHYSGSGIFKKKKKRSLNTIIKLLYSMFHIFSSHIFHMCLTMQKIDFILLFLKYLRSSQRSYPIGWCGRQTNSTEALRSDKIVNFYKFSCYEEFATHHREGILHLVLLPWCYSHFNETHI